ncbi:MULTISPECIES: hypothetical protein [unclassified Pseudomonas]|uniref:hypothetical protein n=1 Tax=unclassified Pseudomonas TaxID=196821 RepID=UPI00147480B0|nr:MULTISPECIES: hypothetical protein [unclassified Pseudomonas]NMX90566.1 hypothetical protein [Pseudomonas sp. WS 5086]NMY45772.1 hypothetical protein [Pseudomonas sp. WS 5027]
MLYQAHTQNEQAVSGSNTGNRKPEIQAAMADWNALVFCFSELGGATEKRRENGGDAVCRGIEVSDWRARRAISLLGTG